MADLTTRLQKFLGGLVSGTPTIENVGGGTQTGGIPVSIFTSVTPVANGTTVETDLASYTMPAGTLGANGQKLRITAWGTNAANANTKRIRVYLGTTVIADSGARSPQASWFVQVTLARITAATQTTNGIYNDSATGYVVLGTTASTETLTSALVVKTTGQSSAASSDATLTCMTVEWLQ